MPKFEEVPPYKYDRSANLTDEETKRTDKFIRDRGKRIHAYGEIEPTAEQREQLQALLENQQEWTQEVLGISLGDRMPQPHQFQIFDPKVWREQDTKGAAGGLNTKEMKLQLSADYLVPHILSHEMNHMIHGATYKIERLEYASNLPFPKLLLQGYTREPKDKSLFDEVGGSAEEKLAPLHQLNEYLTETENIEQLDFLRRQHPDKDYILDPVGYHHGVIWLDTVFAALAQQRGEDVTQVRNDLYRGQYKGDFAALKVFDETFGRGSLAAIAKIPERAHSGYMEWILMHMGIDAGDFADKLSRYERGEEIQLSSGVELQSDKWKQSPYQEGCALFAAGGEKITILVPRKSYIDSDRIASSIQQAFGESANYTISDAMKTCYAVTLDGAASQHSKLRQLQTLIDNVE